MKKLIVFLLICAITLSFMGGVGITAEEVDGESDGQILASFHAIYDVHVPRDTASYEKSLKNMGQINPDTTIALVIGGDNTTVNATSELDTFYGLLKQYNPVSNEQTVVIIGNHEARGPNENGNWSANPEASFPYWPTAKATYAKYNKDYMPASAQETLYHVKELGGYTFIALNTELGLKDQMYMSDEYLAWFEQTMKEAYEADPNKPIFIICHQAMQNTVWRSWSYGLDNAGSNYDVGLDEKVQKILEKYPTAIFISGHMHNEFDQIEAVFRPWATFIDVPAHYADAEKGREGGLGYEVEIYADKVVFRAVNFAKQEWYPEHDLVVPTVNGGFAAIYQTAKKQMKNHSDQYDFMDRCSLGEFEDMLTKTYKSTIDREKQFFYTAEDIERICTVAAEFKTLVGPVFGEPIFFKDSELNLQLTSNDTVTISALVGDGAVLNKHLVWSSSDKSVANVVDGQITAVSAGKATISAVSAYDSTVKAECVVYVTDPNADGAGETSAKGCRGSIGVLPMALLPMLAPIFLKKKKK